MSFDVSVNGENCKLSFCFKSLINDLFYEISFYMPWRLCIGCVDDEIESVAL